MCTVATADSTFSLGEVEMWMHVGVGVNEPGIDVMDRILHIDIGAAYDPGKSVVQDGVGHGLEFARIVDQSNIRVEKAVALHILAFRVDYE